MPYCNNLRRDDPVFDVETKRPGKVAANPRDSSVNVAVLFQGNSTPRQVHISRLRLIVEGKPEEAPPCDGEPPAPEIESPRAPRAIAATHATPLQLLEGRRTEIKNEMESMTKRATELRAEDDRLGKAIAVLSA